MKRRIRVTLARFMGCLLAAQSRPYPFPTGPTLVIAPHADDETLGCGQLLAALGVRQHPVVVAYVTDSAAPHPSYPDPSRGIIAARRRSEAEAALRALGLDSAGRRFLGAPDGRMDRLAAAELTSIRSGIAGLLRSVKPAQVFVPLLGDGSSEHDATHWLVTEAIAATSTPSRLWEYAVWAWWNPLRLRRQLDRPAENHFLADQEANRRKHAALEAHRSQIPPGSNPPLPPDFRAACCGPAEFYFCRRP
ncbi:MAG TPA: PIG-L family deacetylase [Candidatus Didemnitutus sp.]|jgi:LmbE family N-acetylglucosaminyl deacetylase